MKNSECWHPSDFPHLKHSYTVTLLVMGMAPVGLCGVFNCGVRVPFADYPAD